jgi:hypothetical protein
VHRELDRGVERGGVVLDGVRRAVGRRDLVRRGHAELEPDVVGAQHLLAGHREQPPAHVDALDPRARPREPVAARLERAHVAAVAVEQPALVLLDRRALEQRAHADSDGEGREQDQQRELGAHAEPSTPGSPTGAAGA